MNSVSTISSIQNSAGSGLKNGRLTIAYLTPHIGTTVNRLRWTGVVEQVAIDDITLINIEKDAIFDLYYETSADNSTSPASVPITEETPQIRDITITHMICRGAERAILLRGLPEMPLRNIRFEHLHLIAKNGITRVNTENITFHDVLIEDPHGNTILCS